MEITEMSKMCLEYIIFSNTNSGINIEDLNERLYGLSDIEELLILSIYCLIIEGCGDRDGSLNVSKDQIIWCLDQSKDLSEYLTNIKNYLKENNNV